MKINKFLKIIINNQLWNFFLVKFFLPNILNLVERKPKIILEIGCGAGFTTHQLAKRFSDAQITAIDYDAEQVSKAEYRLNLLKNVNIQKSDATKLSFTPESFDAIFAFNTFHHIANFQEAIKEVSRVLKPQGFFYLMDEGKEFFGPILKWIDKPETFFTLNELKSIVEEYNLRCKKETGSKKIFYLAFKKII